MTSEKLYELLGDLREERVQSVRQAEVPRRRRRRWWAAAAACLCAAVLLAPLAPPLSPAGVTTASGLLTVTAYASTSEETVVMEEGIDLPADYRWSLAMSSRPGVPLELTAPGHPDAAFEIAADGGALLLWEEGRILPQTPPFTAANGTTIYWTSLIETEEGTPAAYSGSTAHIQVVVREEGHIIGYAVIQIYREDAEWAVYRARLLRSVFFPKVDGAYQDISASYVAGAIQEVKAQAGGE